VIGKVLVYVIRARELLVFGHVDVDAGIQVPKGTIESDETPPDAAKRELFEETGLRANTSLHAIGTLAHYDELWHFYSMSANADAPNVWLHKVSGVGDDNGMQFRFFWLPLTPTPRLIGGQGKGLQFLESIGEE
jgi:8-oxo-dGTP pyrophosphatase MutT (NUDIX family)